MAYSPALPRWYRTDRRCLAFESEVAVGHHTNRLLSFQKHVAQQFHRERPLDRRHRHTGSDHPGNIDRAPTDVEQIAAGLTIVGLLVTVVGIRLVLDADAVRCRNTIVGVDLRRNP